MKNEESAALNNINLFFCANEKFFILQLKK